MSAKILVVDDEDLVRKTLRVILEKAGHDVSEASTGAAAVRHFSDVPPDLVLCDILMPDQDGVETIARMREHQSEVPIVAMSGGGRTGKANYLDHARELGADAVLEKPVARKDLLELIERLLSARGA